MDIIATSQVQTEVFCKISAKPELSASTIPLHGDFLTEILITEYTGGTFYHVSGKQAREI